MSAKKNKFAKFAKFGIVLLSTVTIATVAQSQQGNVSHHVYAEEVSQPDYDSWRMFYVHSADYPNDPNDGGMAGRVITPDSPYVVGNESFRAPGTYSRYEVFDDTGKRYNPGDTITVDDPVVNHVNEEDNNIYYYYYPLDPSASETPAPAPSTSPSTSEAPAPSTSPSTSEAPAPSTSPSTSEAPAPSTSPSTSEAPAPSTSPSTSEAPAPSTSPSTSEAPAPSTSPSTSEAANKDHAVEKPSQKADDKTTATDKAKNATDKKTDSKKAKDQVKTEKSEGATSEKTVAAKDNSTSKTAEASAPAEQAKAVKANTNANSQDNIVKEADGTVDTAAVHNDNNGGFLLTMLGFVSAAVIGLFKNKKEEK